MEEDDGPYHVYPVNDLKEHRLDEFCECQPVYSDGIWLHTSFDGRELIEDLLSEDNIFYN
jgi:hypothetical protein